MRFTHEVCRALEQKVENALRPIAEEFGINIRRGSGRFSVNNFTLKIEMSNLDVSGVALTREREDWNLYGATLFGMTPDWLDKTFTYNGELYRIKGIKRKSRKYPVLAENVGTGKVYKFPVDTIKAFMGRI